MNARTLRDERGVAMLLELVLVALVLSLVGVALYQSNHQKPKDAATTVQSQLTTPEATAEAAASLVERDSADDASLSAAVDSSADELSAADADAANLEGSFNENSF
jgi:Tfp pilus assembly protein PilX